jgi:hypothetical protein
LREALHVKVEGTGTDAVELEGWAKHRGEEVSMAISFSKTAINRYFSSTGDLPPGVEIVTPHDVLTIKCGK